MSPNRRQRRRRAAAIGGAAMAAKKNRDQTKAEQAQPDDAPGQPAAPAGAGGASEEDLTRLKELGELHSQGILTDEESEREKAKLLG